MNKLVLLVAALLAIVCSCKKETKTETVTVRDTIYVQVHDTTIIPTKISDTVTTFIVLRHAEKEATGTDPNLDADGILRAEELKYILSNVSVNAIYSTPFNRTKQTVQPLATAKGIAISEYQASLSYSDLVKNVLVNGRGKLSVIVGHSNTVPDLLKEMSKGTFNVSIAESQYDNLFIISMPEKLTPTITQLKYGKHTP